MDCTEFRRLISTITKENTSCIPSELGLGILPATLPLGSTISKNYLAFVHHSNDCISCGDAYQALQVERSGGKVADYPCVHIAYRRIIDCKQHGENCPDVIIKYNRKHKTYSFPHPDQNSVIEIAYCPWCGKKL